MTGSIGVIIHHAHAQDLITDNGQKTRGRKIKGEGNKMLSPLTL
jgi:hypothetical protein